MSIDTTLDATRRAAIEYIRGEFGVEKYDIMDCEQKSSYDGFMEGANWMLNYINNNKIRTENGNRV